MQSDVVRCDIQMYYVFVIPYVILQVLETERRGFIFTRQRSMVRSQHRLPLSGSRKIGIPGSIDKVKEGLVNLTHCVAGFLEENQLKPEAAA